MYRRASPLYWTVDITVIGYMKLSLRGNDVRSAISTPFLWLKRSKHGFEIRDEAILMEKSQKWWQAVNGRSSQPLGMWFCMFPKWEVAGLWHPSQAYIVDHVQCNADRCTVVTGILFFLSYPFHLVLRATSWLAMAVQKQENLDFMTKPNIILRENLFGYWDIQHPMKHSQYTSSEQGGHQNESSKTISQASMLLVEASIWEDREGTVCVAAGCLG